MVQHDDHLRSIGWLALCIVVLGLAIPTSVYFGLGMRYGDDVAWQEGGVVLVFIACLAFLTLCQAVGLLLAWQSWSTATGKAAGVGAICLLAMAGALVGAIVLDYINSI